MQSIIIVVIICIRMCIAREHNGRVWSSISIKRRIPLNYYSIRISCSRLLSLSAFFAARKNAGNFGTRFDIAETLVVFNKWIKHLIVCRCYLSYAVNTSSLLFWTHFHSAQIFESIEKINKYYMFYVILHTINFPIYYKFMSVLEIHHLVTIYKTIFW